MLSTVTSFPVSLFVTALPDLGSAKRSQRSTKATSGGSQPTQLMFDWASDETPTATSDCNTASQATAVPESAEADSAATERNSLATRPRIRKLTRLRRRNIPRPVVGGELWEAAQQDSNPCPKNAVAYAAATHAAKAQIELAKQTRIEARVSQNAVEAGSRMAQPVRIGAAMLQLLKRYGITDSEIQAGLAAYSNRTCQAVAS